MTLRNKFMLDENSVTNYVMDNIDFFNQESILSAKEIGDGNLNFVFRVKDQVSGRSVIVKQAGETARSTPDYKLTTDRNRIECEILQIQDQYAPGLVPKVYKYDPVMCCCIMEDLSDHEVLRTGLLSFTTYPLLAEHISTFLVKTLTQSSDLMMSSLDKKKLVGHFINPELCKISEELVYLDPYKNELGTNDITKGNERFVQENVYSDNQLHLEVAKLRFDFMNKAQALIHGDLHSGSVFVNQESTKVFDPEFAFYGPAGYDVGNIISHLIFSWMHAEYQCSDESQKHYFQEWVESTVSSILELFKKNTKLVLESHAIDTLSNTEGYIDWYIENIIIDTAATAGLEIIRRIVGEAHVKDIENITNIEKRIIAEQRLILMGKELILNKHKIKSGKDYFLLIK